MKAIGIAAVCAFALFVGTAKADVISGNLVTNGDFNSDLSSWTLDPPSGAHPVWTNTTADGGGVLYTGRSAMNLYQMCASNVGVSTDPVTVNFDLGSPDASVSSGQFFARLFHYKSAGGWDWAPASPAESTTITYTQLNAGVQHYTLLFPTLVQGDRYELDLETFAVNNSATILLDNVAVTQGTVPEPSTIAMTFAGLISLMAYAWRKRK